MESYRRSESGGLPLDDLKVVDLTQVLAGPFATMTLGDLGAEVIKVEAVGRGDQARNITPVPEYFDAANRNKRSIAVDLKTEEGQELVKRLLDDADVFVQSAKPGRIETYGLDYATIRSRNPEIIFCSITGFGSGSPYEGVPAWDIIIQGMSGFMSMNGAEETPPLWSGLPSGDLIASMYAVQSILAALYARDDGQIEGEHIEVPMLDAAISWLTIRAGHTFGTGEPFPRHGVNHPRISPFGIFECKDESIIIAAGTDSLWEEFCTALGCPDLAERDDYASLEGRLENRADLRGELDSILSEHSADYWLERFHEADVPAGPIYDTASVWSDDHVKQRGLWRKMERDNDQPDAEVIDHPIHFQNINTALDIPPESLGESTRDVLRRHGYSGEDIELLEDKDVIQ